MIQYILRRHREIPDLNQLEVYRNHGGFEAFQKAVTAMQPEEVTEVVKASGLRGRGGAGFPTRMKWAFTDMKSCSIVGSANRKAARVARRFRKPVVGGSDAHNARYVGFGYTLIAAEPTIPSILAAIREGRTAAGGRMTPLRTYSRQSLRSAWKRVRRRIRR